MIKDVIIQKIVAIMNLGAKSKMVAWECNLGIPRR